MEAKSVYRSRAEALNMGVAKYFTGRPCLRGHVADRYALNSGCVECMRRNNIAVREKTNAEPDPRRDSLEELAQVGMRLFHEDVPKFSELAVAMALARFPALTRADVVRKTPATGVAAGTGFYPYRAHPDDVQMLRDVAAAYCSERVRGGEKVIAARLATVAEAAAKERDNGAGEWKFT